MKQARQNLATQMDDSKEGYIEYLQQHRSNSCNSSQFVQLSPDTIRSLVTVHHDPYEALKDSHAIAILTEWDETKFDEVNSAPTPTWKYLYKMKSQNGTVIERAEEQRACPDAHRELAENLRRHA